MSQQRHQWQAFLKEYELDIKELLDKVILEVNIPVVIADPSFEEGKGPRIIYANPAYFQWLGLEVPQDEQLLDPIFLYEHITPADSSNIKTIFDHLSVQEDALGDFYRQVGNLKQTIQFRISPLSDTHHCFKAVLMSQHLIFNSLQQLPSDISSNTRVSREKSIATAQSYYLSTHPLPALIDALPGIVFICNHDQGWSRRSLSLGCLKLTGYSPEQLLESSNLTYNSLIDAKDFTNLQETISIAIEKGQSYTVEYRIHTKSGQQKWVLEQGCGILGEHSQWLGIEGFISDITVLKQREAQLQNDVFLDPLTNLPSRFLFIERLEYSIKRSKRHPDQIFAVLCLDIDRFKVINDSLGHAAGDQLLCDMARRLAACVRESDTLARLGGDEFTVLLEGIKDLSDALQVCSRIQAALNRSFCLNGREILATVSIGVTLSTMGYDDPEQLLHNADAAMHRAKSMGKAQWEVFTAQMHSNASTQLQLEVDLRRAIERQEFQLHYQPIYHLETAAIVGFEALLRWHHPVQGLISPAEFIPIAEETGLILPISWWVLQEACEQLSQWQQQYPSPSPWFVSVNFSSKQFSEVGLISRIEEILVQTGLSPQCLKLEITESAIMEQAEATAAKLLEIKALGIQLGIDDFGTGYSSLSYLHRFPVDILKIDRSFVSQMDSHENLQIVQTITVLAHNLGMKAVAEGVETAEQAAQLRAMACQYAQGYFFSKPMDASSMASLLKTHLQSSSLESAVAPLARLQFQVNAAYSYRPLVGHTSWTIGSHHSCDVLLAEANVAPKHAMLQLMGTGNYYLVNLAPHASVVVNGHMVERPTLLQDCDRIIIGNTNFLFNAQTTYSATIAPTTPHKSVLMCHALPFQGEIWQAALTSQGLSVTWHAVEVDIKETLTTMQDVEYPLPDLLLIDTHALSETLEDLCIWCKTHVPQIKLMFINGDLAQVALSEQQSVIDQGAIDLVPGFSEQNVLSNLVATLTKLNTILQALEWQPLDRKALIAALMPMQKVVKQGVFQ